MLARGADTRTVDFGDETAEFDGVLWQERLREDDAPRHVGRHKAGKVSRQIWVGMVFVFCSHTKSGGVSRPNTSHKKSPDDVASYLNGTNRHTRDCLGNWSYASGKARQNQSPRLLSKILDRFDIPCQNGPAANSPTARHR
jgi:hypothetical protein